MKYRFITIMHNLKLDNVKNKGISVFKGARISNGTQVLEETVNCKPMKYTIGIHSSDEFKDKVYIYIDGQLDDISNIEEMDKIGGQYTFYLLRMAQGFTYRLWNVKDNNIYIRDGFLLVYNKEFKDGCTYKASLSEVYSYSTIDRKESVFLDNEISSAASDFNSSMTSYSYLKEFDYKYPVSDIFLKSRGSERLDRALYFTMSARKMAILPMKIVFYVNALECLFTIGNQEISHKVSERIAILLGATSKSKRELFDVIKKAYTYRSSLVHGQYIKGSDDTLVETSKNLDNILRTLFNKHEDIFRTSDEKMENYFINLIFQDV